MNWLAWDTRSYLGAALGAALGWWLFHALLDGGAFGAELFAPWTLGLGMGLGCALVTKERSGLRGVVLACATAWLAAVAHVLVRPPAPDAGLLDGLLAFHTVLDPVTLLEHLAGIAGAFLFGRTSFRPDAQDRVAGSGRREFGAG